MTFNNNEDFTPGRIGKDFTGPEVFDLCRMAIDEQIKRAEAELVRRANIVKTNASNVGEPDDVWPSIPGCLVSLSTEDQIAYQAAQAQLAALKQVWWAVLTGVAGPSITGKTQDAVEESRANFKSKTRAALDRLHQERITK